MRKMLLTWSTVSPNGLFDRNTLRYISIGNKGNVQRRVQLLTLRLSWLANKNEHSFRPQQARHTLCKKKATGRRRSAFISTANVGIIILAAKGKHLK